MYSDKKVLIAFSDPGGAKPLLAFAEQNVFKDLLVASDREYPFYTDFKTRVIQKKEIDLTEIIQSFNPDFIITGTSYPSIFEKTLLQLSLQSNINCAAYIDHYTRMNDRLQLEDGTFIQPNEVWVIDERAKQIAEDSKIQNDSIEITGNFYQTWLKNWKPKLTKSAFLDLYQIPKPNDKILLFAPDPLSNIDGMEKYGFDELTVTKELVDFITSNQISPNITIWIKAHPNQDILKLEAIVRSIDNIVLLPTEVDTNTAIFYSDIVIGFFSSILIEADLLQKKTLRYLPKKLNPDPLESKLKIFNSLSEMFNTIAA